MLLAAEKLSAGERKLIYNGCDRRMPPEQGEGPILAEVVTVCCEVSVLYLRDIRKILKPLFIYYMHLTPYFLH